MITDDKTKRAREPNSFYVCNNLVERMVASKTFLEVSDELNLQQDIPEIRALLVEQTWSKKPDRTKVD